MNDKESTKIVIDGELLIKGEVFIGKQCHFEISSGSQLILEDGVNFTGLSTIVCDDKIHFEENCLVSWNTLFMDSDAHTVTDSIGNVNYNKPINIGKNVWIGANCTVLKGTIISDGIVVATDSLVLGKYLSNNSIIGGNVAKLIKSNIDWNINKPKNSIHGVFK